jgi:hypothetical protein
VRRVIIFEVRHERSKGDVVHLHEFFARFLEDDGIDIEEVVLEVVESALTKVITLQVEFSFHLVLVLLVLVKASIDLMLIPPLLVLLYNRQVAMLDLIGLVDQVADNAVELVDFPHRLVLQLPEDLHSFLGDALR